jgi:polyphenol oxidase
MLRRGLIEVRLGSGRAIWTDRRGGVSAPPYDTANLSLACGDDPASVTENRRRLADALGLAAPEGWWWPKQVHGPDVRTADGPPPAVPPACDALVTTRRGLPLVVLTADCAPIAIANDESIGVVHAGWRGLLAGVVDAAIATLDGRGPVRAVVGPCIHAARYPFGRAELDQVVARFGPDVEGSTTEGSPALDLPAAVRIALTEAGASDIEDLDVCTAASPDHFSHRRDSETGRQGLVVVLDA